MTSLPSFEDVFYNFNPNLVTGSLKYIIKGSYTPEEQDAHMLLLLNGFLSRNKLDELLVRMVTEEVLDCSTTPTSMFRRNSVQSKVVKYYVDLELAALLDGCVLVPVQRLLSHHQPITVCTYHPTRLTDSSQMNQVL